MNITGDCELLLDKELRYGLRPLKIEHHLLLFRMALEISAERLLLLSARTKLLPLHH